MHRKKTYFIYAAIAIALSSSCQHLELSDSTEDHGVDTINLARVDWVAHNKYDLDMMIMAEGQKLLHSHNKNDVVTEAQCFNNLFWVNYINGRTIDAYRNGHALVLMADSLKNIYMLGQAYHNLGVVSGAMNNPSIAGRNFNESRLALSEVDNQLGIASMMLDKAKTHYESGIFDSAKVALNGANTILNKLNNREMLTRYFAYSGEMELYRYINNKVNPDYKSLELSIQLLENAQNIQEGQTEYLDYLINACLGLANYHLAISEPNEKKRANLLDTSLAYINKAIPIVKISRNQSQLRELTLSKMDALLRLNRNNEAMDFLSEMEQLQEHGDTSYLLLATQYDLREIIARHNGKYQEAYEYQTLAQKYLETLNNEREAFKISLIMARTLNTDERNRAKANLMEIKAQTRIRNLIIMIIFLVMVSVLVMVIVIRRNYHKAKKLNSTIVMQNEELLINNQMLEKFSQTINSQNKDLKSSINYASLIQKAILPNREKMESVFGKFAMYYSPRDVVSGDFVWVLETPRYKLLAVGDCTGHGVPGAMLSMLGTSILTQETRHQEERHYTAGEILDRVKNTFKKLLNQTSYESNQPHDSIDLALVMFDKQSTEMQFAGAHRPCLIVRDKEIITIREDIMPIGVFINEKEHFTNNRMEMQENDIIYLFSDGIQDQFGWKEGKNRSLAFSSKRLKETILQIHELPFQKQEEALANILADWRKPKVEDFEVQPQTDDNVLVAIRVGNVLNQKRTENNGLQDEVLPPPDNFTIPIANIPKQA